MWWNIFGCFRLVGSFFVGQLVSSKKTEIKDIEMAIPSAPIAVSRPRRAFQSEFDCNDDHSVPLDIGTSYDGSSVVFRLLRLETWGAALMNLGFQSGWRP